MPSVFTADECCLPVLLFAVRATAPAKEGARVGRSQPAMHLARGCSVQPPNTVDGCRHTLLWRDALVALEVPLPSQVRELARQGGARADLLAQAEGAAMLAMGAVVDARLPLMRVLAGGLGTQPPHILLAA